MSDVYAVYLHYTHHVYYKYKCSKTSDEQISTNLTCWDFNLFCPNYCKNPVSAIFWVMRSELVVIYTDWMVGTCPVCLKTRTKRVGLLKLTSMIMIMHSPSKHKMDLRRDKMCLTFAPWTFQFEQHRLEAGVDSPQVPIQSEVRTFSNHWVAHDLIHSPNCLRHGHQTCQANIRTGLPGYPS